MTKKQIETIRKRVKRGIKWLDKEKPNWINKVFFRKLSMGSTSTCICGQVFGDFNKVCGNQVAGIEAILPYETIISFGFEVTDSSYGKRQGHYDTLGEVWKEEIRKIKKHG